MYLQVKGAPNNSVIYVLFVSGIIQQLKRALNDHIFCGLFLSCFRSPVLSSTDVISCSSAQLPAFTTSPAAVILHWLVLSLHQLQLLLHLLSASWSCSYCFDRGMHIISIIYVSVLLLQAIKKGIDYLYFHLQHWFWLAVSGVLQFCFIA